MKANMNCSGHAWTSPSQPLSCLLCTSRPHSLDVDHQLISAELATVRRENALVGLLRPARLRQIVSLPGLLDGLVGASEGLPCCLFISDWTILSPRLPLSVSQFDNLYPKSDISVHPAALFSPHSIVCLSAFRPVSHRPPEPQVIIIIIIIIIITMPSFPNMPRLIDVGTEDESLLRYGTRKTRRFIDGFMDFATQGNILEIAFGLM